MTTRYKTRAFVFKKNDVNESDRVFSVFTDDFGRLDIFAKAIRKNVSKLRSGIDIFFFSEIEFIQGKNRKTLTDAVLKDKFNNSKLGIVFWLNKDNFKNDRIRFCDLDVNNPLTKYQGACVVMHNASVD